MSQDRIPVQALVIGGGAVGLSIALTLAKKGKEVVVVEREERCGAVQSARNSGVIHAGIYYAPESLKARLCRDGSRLLYEFCRTHAVPHKKTGKLVIATNAAEEKDLASLAAQAKENGLDDLEMLSPADLALREPNLQGHAALFVPQSGVIDPGAYVAKLAHLCAAQGVDILLRTTAVTITTDPALAVSVRDSAGRAYTILPELLVNAAGLFADQLARVVNPQNPWTIGPVRGEYATFSMRTRGTLALNNPLVYPVPRSYKGADGESYTTLGIHLTPTFRSDGEGQWSLGDTVLVGPSAQPMSDSADLRGNRYPIAHFVSAIRPFFPAINEDDCSLGDAGITARLLGSHRDFVIERDALHPRVIHCVGIDSPGLTASLAIGRYVARVLLET